jgi:hypothetical protein
MARRFSSFREFYPFYLEEHSRPATRRLHFAGMVLALAILVAFAVTLQWWLLLAAPVGGYGLSWIGHFAFEHNRPATLGHPFYSFLGDLMMFRDMLIGRIKF